MKKYTTYDLTTGEILGTVTTATENHLKEKNYISGDYDGAINYIVNGEIVVRPLLDPIIIINKHKFEADGLDEIIISSLPNCVIVVNNLDEPNYKAFNNEITDSELTIVSSMPGIYRVCIDCFPYKQYIVDLEGV